MENPYNTNPPNKVKEDPVKIQILSHIKSSRNLFGGRKDQKPKGLFRMYSIKHLNSNTIEEISSSVTSSVMQDDATSAYKSNKRSAQKPKVPITSHGLNSSF
jgi:hypothetical protein